MSSETAVENKRLIGQVKWFNSKAGYGFITVTADNDYNGKDIFTHYTAINVTNSQYKYLVQGEYVEFELSESANENHKYQATNVTGIQNGKLMCETRQQYRAQQRSAPSGDANTEGFTKVVGKRQKSKKATSSTPN